MIFEIIKIITVLYCYDCFNAPKFEVRNTGPGNTTAFFQSGYFTIVDKEGG